MTGNLSLVAAPGAVVDLCAGPGGWDIAARQLGMHDVIGLERDPVACRTRASAGHLTVCCDIAQVSVETLRYLAGLIGSPPCTTFSAAGQRAATQLIEFLAALIRDEFTGRAGRAELLTSMERALRQAGWPKADLSKVQQRKAIREAVESASLIAEPARYIRAAMPGWIALEQVPAAGPLFAVYDRELRKLGYSVWYGTVNAADYGLGQIRRRAILIASALRAVTCPAPTHYDPSLGLQMFGQPWLSMHDVIGWGYTRRPSPTVTGGGIKSGGADPFGHRSRDALAGALRNGEWSLFGRADGGSGDDGQFLARLLRPTPAECARLQGFPDDYPFAGNAGLRYRQAGDAIPPPLALAILAEATGLRRQQEAP